MTSRVTARAIRGVPVEAAERHRLDESDRGERDWRGWRLTTDGATLRLVGAEGSTLVELGATHGRSALEVRPLELLPSGASGAWAMGEALRVSTARRGPRDLLIEVRTLEPATASLGLAWAPGRVVLTADGVPVRPGRMAAGAAASAARGAAADDTRSTTLRVTDGTSLRLRVTPTDTPTPTTDLDIAATLGLRARESEAFLARLLPRDAPRDDVRIGRRLLAQVLATPPADGWEAGFVAAALASIDPTEARRLAVRATEHGAQGPGTTWPASPPIGAWAATRVVAAMPDRASRVRALETSLELLLGVTSGLLDEQDPRGRNALRGGLLSVSGDRPMPQAAGWTVADGPAWVGVHILWLLGIAGELARHDPQAEDIVMTLLDSTVAAIDALESMAGAGSMWDAEAGGYRPVGWHRETGVARLPIRSLVSWVPLLGVAVVPGEVVERSSLVADHIDAHLRDRPELSGHVIRGRSGRRGRGDVLVQLASRARLGWALESLLDPDVQLAPWGLRSLAMAPMSDGETVPRELELDPAGRRDVDGSPVWTGQVHVAMTVLLADALRVQAGVRDAPVVIHPTGSGHLASLAEVAADLETRVLTPVRIAQADGAAWRPDGAWHADDGWALHQDAVAGTAALWIALEALSGGAARPSGRAGRTSG